MRIKYLDYTKGIAILFIIMGHIYLEGNFITWIYSFHVPLFFIISGIVMNYDKSKCFKEFFIKKFKSIMLPYILFSIFNILSYGIIGKLPSNSVKLSVIYTISLFGINAVWFLGTLFISENLFFLINKKNSNIYKELLCYGALIIITLASFKLTYGIIVHLLSRITIALFFINFGYYYFNIINKINFKSYNIICLLMISSLLAQVNGKVDLWSLKFNNLFLYVFNSITGSLAIIFMMKKINRSKVLDFLGQNTLIIMATHQLIIKSILATSIGTKLNKLVLLCLVLIIEYPIIKIINRYLPFMLGKKRIKTIKNEKLNTSIG